MSDTIKTAIFTAFLTIPAGYGLHVLKSKFDKKEIIKSTSRIFKRDIDHVCKLANFFVQSNVNRAISDKLSSFTDWKNEFYKISSSLNDEQSDSLIKFYDIVDRLVTLQKEAKDYDDNIKQRYPKMRGPYNFGDGVMNSINREFIELMNQINYMEIEELKSVIETNSI